MAIQEDNLTALLREHSLAAGLVMGALQRTSHPIRRLILAHNRPRLSFMGAR